MVDRPAEGLSGRGVRELAVVAALAIALTVLLTWPLALTPGSIGRADTDDGRFSLWNVAWVARTIVADPLNVFNANIFYPHQGTLAYSEANLGAGVLAIPGYWLTRNPYFAHNTAVLIAFVLCFVGTYALARYLIGDPRAAAVAAICYTFAPCVFVRTPHIQLMMTLGLPYTMLAFHRLADRPTAGRGIALGAAMAATTYFCAYYGVFAVLMVGLAVVFVATSRGLWSDRPYWLAVAVAAVTAVLLILPLIVPYMRLQGQGFSRSIEEAGKYAATWHSYITSPARAHVWLYDRLGKGENTAFPGFVATTFGIAGALSIARYTGRAREHVALYCTLAVLAFWTSLGPAAGLYAVFYRLVPGFTLMRAPERFGLVVVFALAVVAAYGVHALLERVAWPRLAAAIVTVAAVADHSVVMPFVPAVPTPAVYATLAGRPLGPVIEMPFFTRAEGGGLFKHSEWMLYSTSHWFPLINGYSDYIPPDYLERQLTFAGFPSSESMRLLAATHVRYAVFHRHRYTGATWSAAMDRLRDFAPYFRLLQVDKQGENGETRLYEIVGFPPQ